MDMLKTFCLFSVCRHKMYDTHSFRSVTHFKMEQSCLFFNNKDAVPPVIWRGEKNVIY